MWENKQYTGDQGQLSDDEFALRDVSGGDEVPPEDWMLLHPHRPTLVFVTPPVALLVFLATVVDASAAGALLQRFRLANRTFSTHFARKIFSAIGRRVLNKAARSRDIGAWSARHDGSLFWESASVRRGLIPTSVRSELLCFSIKAIGSHTHISAATFYARRRDPFTRQTSCIQTISRVICGRK